ncbi:MAG TPA: FtsX-like permease family protein [Bryobacteraceae bacterium]|jgi:hypothetical protein|nr:FtsX-like permease family protein [Bryobacteraceae bacterium]
MALSLRNAFRSFSRSPGFTLLAIAILALGIGATTAMFSITRTVLLKPLAYRDPGSLATLLFRVPQFAKDVSTIPVNAQHYLLWRDHSRTLEEVGLVFTSRRTSEIGIRMAVGARPAQILESTLIQGMTPVVVGVSAGLCLSAGFARIFQSLLFQVRALDPFIYAGTAFAILVIASLACLVPARRAANLNPVDALRHE